MRQRVSGRLRTYWWVWLVTAVVVGVANELFDRKVAGDEKGHPVGDILVAILVILIAVTVWELLAARTSRRRSS